MRAAPLQHHDQHERVQDDDQRREAGNRVPRRGSRGRTAADADDGARQHQQQRSAERQGEGEERFGEGEHGVGVVVAVAPSASLLLLVAVVGADKGPLLQAFRRTKRRR